MRTVIKIIFTILIPLNIFGQTENINSGKYHPAKEVFESKYQKEEYSKFASNKIKIENNKIILDNLKFIEFDEKSDTKTKLILSNGFLDPYKINGSINLKISKIDELSLLNPNPQTKRFKFWIFPIQNQKVNSSELEKMLSNRINPSEYYFELQNKFADENTSFEDFIKGANLIFLIFGTIII
jgi:hypothetical protein